MSKRNYEKRPKIWRDNAGSHFNPYFELARTDRILHERGLDHKTIRVRGAKAVSTHARQAQSVSASGRPVTLPRLNWTSKS